MLDPSLLDDMPATRAWLTHAETTRRMVRENYSHVDGAALLTAAVEENVLVQIEHLRTHPTVRSRLARAELSVHAWVYKIETGDVFQYDHETGQFEHLAGSMRATAMPETVTRLRAV
jgi:carbonic anhydrase